MSKKALTILFLAIFIPNHSFGAISGTVVTPEQKPLEGAEVYLASNPQLVCTTDENGDFNIDLLSKTVSGQEFRKDQFIAIRNNNFELTLPHKEKVKMDLFALSGKKLISLHDGELPSGEHKIKVPQRIIAHQNMLLRASIGQVSSTYFLSPSGIIRESSPLVTAKKSFRAKTAPTDSLILKHSDYPRLSVPVLDPTSIDTIIAIDSTRGTATDIHVDIYEAMNTSYVLDSIDGLREGALILPVTKPHPDYSEGFHMKAISEGFYSELYYFNQNETVYLDLDRAPSGENILTGVIMGRQTYFGNCYARNLTLSIAELDVSAISDDQGRFLFTDIPPGIYTVEFTYQGMQFSSEVNTAENEYHDIIFLEPMQADAPNIYLYPEATSEISLSLSFPNGGNVFLSEPEYGHGWTVTVDTSGFIEDTVPYLFYEAMVNGPFTTDKGWIIDESNLTEELELLLQSRGFKGREIVDFLQFWIPVLDDAAPYFAVYPQDAESLIEHHVTPEPESILRELWIIRSLDAPISISEPDPIKFERNGFTLVEWGVLLS
ncbi:MAG: carboxypeptidase-like regulatory domain-containing protein, partial [Chitinispirillaceae bacterium]